MNKRVPIAAKPKGNAQPADDWVSRREVAQPAEEIKRLTIDIPNSLHRIIKASCAERGEKMADEIRKLLKDHYMRQQESAPEVSTD